MEHRGRPDDVIVQMSAAAVAAVDERSSTSQIEEEVVAGDGKFAGAGLTRRTFSESYKLRHRNPMVRFDSFVFHLVSDHGRLAAAD